MKRITSLILLLVVSLFYGCKKEERLYFAGEIEWKMNIGGDNIDEVRRVILTPNDQIAVVGFTSSINGTITDKQTEQNDVWLTNITQNKVLNWSKTYGGSLDDKGNDIANTLGGGYVIAAYNKSSDGDATQNLGQHDNWILKLEKNGDLAWQKSYGFSGHDHAFSVLSVGDDGFVLGGFLDVSASNGQGDSGKTLHGAGEYWIHRLNNDGSIRWRKYFGGSNNDRIIQLLHSNDGGFILVGLTESNDIDVTGSNGSYDFWIVKVDINGTLVWQSTFGGSDVDQPRGAVKAEDNTYLVVGVTASRDGDITEYYGNNDVWIIKIDDDGKLVWQKTYGGSNADIGNGICSSQDGGFWITGATESNDHHVTGHQGNSDFWVFKINSAGDLLWQSTYGGSEADIAYDVAETNNKSIIVIGTSLSKDGDFNQQRGNEDAWVLKIK